MREMQTSPTRTTELRPEVLLRFSSPIGDGREDFLLALIIRGKPLDDFICRAIATNTDVLIIQRADLDTG